MRITEINLFRIDLPLDLPFHHFSSGVISTLEEVVASVKSEDGTVGYGEVRGNSPYLTGDTPDRVVAAAAFIAQSLIGGDLENFTDLNNRIQQSIVGNSGAKALLDIALHDLYGKMLGIPVYGILGGRLRSALFTDIDISFGSADEVAEEARVFIQEGFRLIKLRVGMGLETDRRRLGAVREVIDRAEKADTVELAADANGAWKPKEAVRTIQRLQEFRILFIEQPVAGDDVNGMRFVRENCDIPVMADESVHGIRDVFRLIEAEAVDSFHFKSNKAGGFYPLRRMMAMAESAGISYMMGQTTEGMLATAAAAHAGAASNALHFEVNSTRRVKTQPFSGLSVEQGMVAVPTGPGLGIAVDESRLIHVKRLV